MATLLLLLLRRASSSSSVIPFPLRPSFSFSVIHLHNRLFASRILPFSTSPSLEASDRYEFRNSEKTASVLDRLPFDSIEENPKNGTLTLTRKTKDEIIKIQVKPQTGCYYEDEDYGCFDYGDDIDVHNVYDGMKNTNDKERGESNEEQITDDHDYDDDHDDEDDDHDDHDDVVGGGGVPPLLVCVKIFYGNNFNRCFESFCRAFPNDHDQIAIRHVSIRNSKSSQEVVPLPSGFPFELIARSERRLISMKRTYQKEDIEVQIENHYPICRVDGDDPSIQLEVSIIKWNMQIYSDMIAKPDRLNIIQVLLVRHSQSDQCCDENIEVYKEYLKTKGLMSKTISFLYNRLGYKQKNTSVS